MKILFLALSFLQFSALLEAKETMTRCGELVKVHDSFLYPEVETLYTVPHCKDGTVSHYQPAPNGALGYEGKCGHTSVANIVSMMCDSIVTPNTVFNNTENDATPGIRASTLRNALNYFFNDAEKIAKTCPNGTWSKVNQENSEQFLDSLKKALFWSDRLYETPNVIRKRGSVQVKIQPVPVLLRLSEMDWHWVTVVDLVANDKDSFGCTVVYNEGVVGSFGYQTREDCRDFLNQANTSLNEEMPLYTLLRFSPKS